MNTTIPRDETFTRIQLLVAGLLKLPIESVQPESRLQEDLGCDSLFMTQLVLGLEDEFAVELDATDNVHFATVNSTTDYVMSQIEAS